uniref:Uncharacterized protein n=1 Tax=Sipha flava TaxID=143950 RepID=A0A2S2R8F0_9HEMI
MRTSEIFFSKFRTPIEQFKHTVQFLTSKTETSQKYCFPNRIASMIYLRNLLLQNLKSRFHLKDMLSAQDNFIALVSAKRFVTKNRQCTMNTLDSCRFWRKEISVVKRKQKELKIPTDFILSIFDVYTVSTD